MAVALQLDVHMSKGHANTLHKYVVVFLDIVVFSCFSTQVSIKSAIFFTSIVLSKYGHIPLQYSIL